MFSENQMKKIKYFASVTKIANECFKLCIDLNFDQLANRSMTENKLSTKEETCIKNCSEEYLKLREFIEVQLLNDYESIQNKNKKIMEDET
jgi:hypothetical protein